MDLMFLDKIFRFVYKLGAGFLKTGSFFCVFSQSYKKFWKYACDYGILLGK